MANLTTESAADFLHKVLESQSKLAAEQAEDNRLNSLLLAEQQRANDLAAQKNDLAAQKKEVEKQHLIRLEHRLNEVVQRYVGASEKLITLDDAFAETIQRLMDANKRLTGAVGELVANQQDVNRAILALLSREQREITETKDGITVRQRRLILQAELVTRQQNLNNLMATAAQFGSINVPTHVRNEIEGEEKRIAEIQEVLSNQ